MSRVEALLGIWLVSLFTGFVLWGAYCWVHAQ